MLRVHRFACFAALVAGLVGFLPYASQAQAPLLKRGDANGDKRLNIADPIFLLNHIFNGGKAPRCRSVANANADAYLDISDAIFILSFLFGTQGPLPPLSEAESNECMDVEPPPPSALRHGTFQDVLDPPHGIVGSRVEVLSDHTVRLSNFFYDGMGTPRVVVQLTKDPFSHIGIVISGDLIRNHPYVNETLVFEIPTEVTNQQFNFVNIWCDFYPLHYAIAQLYDGPLP